MRLFRNSICHVWLISVVVAGLAGPILAQDENSATAASDEKISALIVDGQNNHGIWPKTTKMMKHYLEESGRFQVAVATTNPKGTDPDFKPDFSKYSVVISNFGYGAAPWPDETKRAFVEYMKDGGGLVIVHAADNSFPEWPEFNEMIGLGGWGGRNEKSGPYVYYDKDGQEIRDESAGPGGNHGPQHEFSVVIRDTDHPVTKGLPSEFLHSKDELYQQLRGPALNMKILATSFADPKFRGTGRHEPMAMSIDYGKGRVFHTPMGHADYSCECVGFITLFQRGTEWAATGNVTIPIPEDFPTADQSRSRPYTEMTNLAADELNNRIKEMIGMLEGEITADTLANLAGQDQFESLKESDEEKLERMIEAFRTIKAPALIEVLKSLDVSKAEFKENMATFDIQPRTVRFQKVDGVWYLQN